MSADSTVTCANGACAKHLDLSKDTPNVLCPLCASTDTVYCSEACRMIDWVGHKCDNAFLIAAAVGQKQATLFVPYHFEDRLDAKEHKQWVDAMTPEARIEAENQHYLLQVNHPDQTVSQHLIRVGESLTFRPMDPKLETVFRRGVAPHPDVQKAQFEITFSVGDNISFVMTGTVGDRAIWKDHAPPGTDMGGKLKQFFQDLRKESSDTVLFVKPTQEDRDLAPQIPMEGNKMSVEVKINGNVISSMSGPYKMRDLGTEWTRAIGKFFTPRLKSLFPNAATDPIKDYKTLRGTQGHTEFILIFQVPRRKTLRRKDLTSNYMEFRGLVYQVSEGLLRNKSGIFKKSAATSSSVPLESGGGNTGMESVLNVDSGESASPRLSPRDDRDLWDDPQAPPPPAFEAVEGEGGEVAAQEGSTTIDLTEIPEAPPPPPEGYVPPPIPRTESETPIPVSPSESNTPRAELAPGLKPSLVAALTARRKGIAGTGSAIFPLRCDASNVSQLVGLAMALELRERELPPYATTASALVRNHARALMEKRVADPSAVPMDVSAAVYSSIQALHELPAHQ